jgi:hypothetical protein
MHASDFNLHSMAIRHLVLVYATIIVAQGGYFAWIAARWIQMNRKAAKNY